MQIKDKTLYLDQNISFEDFNELLGMIDNVDIIDVKTTDVHPSIWQLLFVLNNQKEIIVEDSFNKRFFDNLKQKL
jgi:hypothetical protein